MQNDHSLAQQETVKRPANSRSAAWAQFKQAITKSARMWQAKAWPMFREKFYQSRIVGENINRP
jgi:hypothetical protein